MSAKLAWDAPQRDKFRQLWLAGVPTREIGKALGCAQSTVLKQAERLGLPSRNGASAIVVVTPPPLPRPRRTCYWPLGDPGTPGFRFCDEPATGAGPYCREHTRRAYARVRREDEG